MKFIQISDTITEFAYAINVRRDKLLNSVNVNHNEIGVKVDVETPALPLSLIVVSLLTLYTFLFSYCQNFNRVYYSFKNYYLI